MEINRITGGIEYRPEIMTLVLPGDRDYRVRTAKVSVSQSARAASQKVTTSSYPRVELYNQGTTAQANQNALAFLRQLGDMEEQGITFSYPGMDVVDEYAGGHYGIIDLWA